MATNYNQRLLFKTFIEILDFPWGKLSKLSFHFFFFLVAFNELKLMSNLRMKYITQLKIVP